MNQTKKLTVSIFFFCFLQWLDYTLECNVSSINCTQFLLENHEKHFFSCYLWHLDNENKKRNLLIYRKMKCICNGYEMEFQELHCNRILSVSVPCMSKLKKYDSKNEYMQFLLIHRWRWRPFKINLKIFGWMHWLTGKFPIESKTHLHSIAQPMSGRSQGRFHSSLSHFSDVIVAFFL